MNISNKYADGKLAEAILNSQNKRGLKNTKNTVSEAKFSTPIPLPNFKSVYACTKSEPEMSDEEYEKAIIAQAQADANGTGSKADYMKLKKSFVSVASPDRNSVIRQWLSKISQGAPNGQLDYFEVTDSKGNKMASYDPSSGWNMFMTPSESIKESEFDTIYNKAYKATLHPENQMNITV